jgi:hypothetical protein
MGAYRNTRRESVRLRRASVVVVVSVALAASLPSAAGAATSPVLATTNGSGAVLVALGGGFLALGIVGFVLFTWSRRKRRPNQCAEQREALELAEKAVRYWEAARAHLEAGARQSPLNGAAVDATAHATALAKANEGLRSAVQQRDERQMDLIRCMASGVPAVPVITTNPAPAQPFFTPDVNGTPTSGPSPTEP